MYLMHSRKGEYSVLSGEMLHARVWSMADTVLYLLPSTFCFEPPLTATTDVCHIAYFAFRSDIFDKFVFEFCDMSEKQRGHFTSVEQSFVGYVT
jgi:hypothetical protein